MSFGRCAGRSTTCAGCVTIHRQLFGASVATRAIPPGLDKLSVTSGVPRLMLHKGRANLFLEGNPIVFSGAISKETGHPQTGDAVVLTDWRDAAVAWGTYNADSMFKCRILQLDREVRAAPHLALDVCGLAAARLTAAAQLRRALRLPRAGTDAYRLVNSEGDGLSGLVVDIYGDHAVAVVSAAWLQLRKAELLPLIRDAARVSSVTWRCDMEMLRSEGLLGASADGAGSGGLAGRRGSELVIEEGGVKYGVDPQGQKTGFYLDQRESRAVLGSLAASQRVLDLGCFSGGFALNAAVGGAAVAVGIDSSEAAIALARRNAELNGVSDRCAFVCAKIEAIEEVAESEGWAPFDIVTLDPPKLAPTRRSLDGATRKYGALNRAAMRMLRPGGLLMTCSCSGAMTQSGGFLSMVAEAARRERRRIVVLRQGGAAMDHVQNPHFPTGQYLTNALVRVD